MILINPRLVPHYSVCWSHQAPNRTDTGIRVTWNCFDHRNRIHDTNPIFGCTTISPLIQMTKRDLGAEFPGNRTALHPAVPIGNDRPKYGNSLSGVAAR